ncbi:MAG: hypothetical protein RL292_621 [Candidatus Parcubacteria bacterium]|jgi:hypothetical protein
MNISWKAPEHMHTEKTADWYWIVGIVSVTLAVISILLGNTLFAILILVGVFTLTLYSTKKPQLVHVELLATGIKIHDLVYLYTNLESFWIEEHELAPRILLKTTKKIAPYVTVLLGDANPDEVRDELLVHLPEIKHSEPFLEKLLIYFGF